MPTAPSRSRDAPMNGQRPRNCTSTKLLTSAAESTISMSSVTSCHLHARGCASVGAHEENAGIAAGGEHHALRYAEAHLARLQVRDEHDELADELVRLVGAADAGEHGTR